MKLIKKSDFAPVAPLWYDFQEGVVLVSEQNRSYKVMQDGSTFLLTPNMEIPITGCPVGDRLMWANFVFFLHRNRYKWPVVVMVAILAVLIQVCLWMVDSPMFDAKLSFIASFSFWMNLTLSILFCLAFVAVAVGVFAGGVSFGLPELMPEPEKTTFSIGSDIIVWSYPDDTQEAFIQRLKEAERVMNEKGVWIAALSFRNPNGIIVRPGETASQIHISNPFHRNDPPFKIEIENKKYTTETYSEYLDYVGKFCAEFPEYAKSEKLKFGNPFDNFVKNI